ncbi:hypothetical protein D3C87_1988290 [compost metagenome]
MSQVAAGVEHRDDRIRRALADLPGVGDSHALQVPLVSVAGIVGEGAASEASLAGHLPGHVPLHVAHPGAGREGFEVAGPSPR